MIYLDYNATAPLLPAVKQAFVDGLEMYGNPSSVHQVGVKARRVVEQAREDLASFVGAKPHQVLFTSGGSEANTMVLASFAGREILVSSVEHDSVLNVPVAKTLIPVDEEGLVDLQALEALLQSRPVSLVSVMAVNNETGVIQPISEIATLVHQYGAELHVDAVQAFGKLPLDFINSGIDFMTLAFHKVGGMKGMGVVVATAHELLVPLIYGGTQEKRLRAGTENVPLFASLSVLVKELRENTAKTLEIQGLRDYIQQQLKDCIVLGKNAPRVANTLCVAMPFVKAETQVIAFDLSGVAVSSGSACSSGKVQSSHVLRAMGIPENIASSAIRVSLGWQTTESDAQIFITTWNALFKRQQQKQAA
jgi:cysteine desulfurase